MSLAKKIEALLREDGTVHRLDLATYTGLSEKEVTNGLAEGDRRALFQGSRDGFWELPMEEESARPREPVPRGYQAADLAPEAERRAEIAKSDPEVILFREVELEGPLLDLDAAAEWIEHRAADGPPYADELHYLRADSAWVQHAGIAPETTLGELAYLSESLAARYGWNPAAASMFVLTDITPPLAIGRTKYTAYVRPEVGLEESITVERRRDDDPEAYARAARAVRGPYKRRNPDLARKYAALVPFVEDRRPAVTWDQIRIEWKAEHPKWKYSSRDKLQRAYEREKSR